MTKDPVCEVSLEEGESSFQMEYNGIIYWFCSEGCKEEFQSDPEKYLKNIDVNMDDDYDHSA